MSREHTYDFRPSGTCCIYSATEPSGHCEKKVFARARCKQHYDDLMRLSPTERAEELERDGKPVRQKFEWAGDEDSLAEHFGRNDELNGENK